jgi:hypothetical protein
MKKLLVVLCVLGGFGLIGRGVEASIIPALSVSSQSANSVSVSVYADPNAAITLYYYSTSAGSSNMQLGTTDGNGNFSTTIDPTAYSIGSGGATYVIVDGQQSSNIPWPAPGSSGSGQISLGENTLSMIAGQSQNISISGSGGYYVSSNSSPSIATAAISGSSLVVSAVSFGGDNITVCQDSSTCSTVYISVSGSGSTPTSTALPTLSSMTITSTNNNGNFLGSGSTLTIAFSSNQTLSSPYVTIAGQRLTANGGGSGPYSVNYTVSGSEGASIPLTIGLQNPSNNINPVYFVIGGNSVPATPVISTPTTVVSVVTPTATASSYSFVNPLTVGATGADVTALQQRLTSDGIYSGPITGYYGSLTEAAVEAFQTKHDLTPLGNVGPNTRALLNSGL